MAGALGGLLIFFSSLIAVVILGLVTLSYAAHGYLAIVEDTAAGSHDVRWPDEAVTDFLWKPFYLAWVWALPVVATWFCVNAFAPELCDGPLGLFVTAGLSLWLLFPIFMLSSLTGRSRVQVLHLALLLRLVRHAGTFLLFYVLTAPVLAAGLSLAFLGLFGRAWVLPVSVPISVALFFIHARLLGRLAWRINQGAQQRQGTQPKKGKKSRKRIKQTVSSDPWAIPDDEDAAEDDDWARTEAADPSSLGAKAIQPGKEDKLRHGIRAGAPPVAFDDAGMTVTPSEASTHIAAGDPRAPTPHAFRAGDPPANVDDEEDEWTPRKKPYALADDVAAEPERPAERDFGPDEVVAAGPVSTAPADADAVPTPEQLFPPDPRFLDPPEPQAPRFALFSNVWNFPVHGSSLRPFISLTLLGLLLALFLRLMLMSRPT